MTKQRYAALDAKALQAIFRVRLGMLIDEQIDLVGARGGNVDEYVADLKAGLLVLCALMHYEYPENDDGAFLNLARNSLAFAAKLGATEQ